MITEQNTMICKVCVSQKDKILLKNPLSDMTFMNDSVDFVKLAVNEHASLECHKQGVVAGKLLSSKYVVHKTPADNAFAWGMQKVGKKEQVLRNLWILHILLHWKEDRSPTSRTILSLRGSTKSCLIQIWMKTKQHVPNPSKTSHVICLMKTYKRS